MARSISKERKIQKGKKNKMLIFCILGKQRPVDDGGGSRRSRWEKPNTEPATENEPTL
jgi:hypothetical protein